MLKPLILFEGNKYYEFETNGIKGFQVGDPKPSSSLFIEIFDNKDQLYTLVFNETITQEEIDYILSSLSTE